MQEIRSRDNSKLRGFLGLYREKKERDAAKLCVLDGVKICRDAALSGVPLKQFWITDTASEKYSDEISEISGAAQEIYLIADHAASRISELGTPQGVFAVAARPEPCSEQEISGSARILGLCGIQNPENVGGSVRTAAALGFGSLLISSDCADIWSPRALRAGAGTQLFCRVCVTSDFRGSVEELKRAGVFTCASALHRDSVPVTGIGEREKLFIAVGSEGRGLPDEVTESCDAVVHIPMSGSAESLNAAAAAAIMMWELRDGSLR